MKQNLNLFICAEHHCNIHFTKLFAAIACGFFLFMFGGVASDCWIAVIAGGAAFLTFSLVRVLFKLNSFRIRCFRCRHHDCATFTKLGIATNQNIITISSVMPLVPGILICNAIRDLMVVNYSWMSRGVEAALTSFAIGAGVAIVLLII